MVTRMNEAKWRSMSHPEKLVWSTIVAQKLVAGEPVKAAVADADKLVESLPVEIGAVCPSP